MCLDISGKNLKTDWMYDEISSIDELFNKLCEYSAQQHRWVFRGVPRKYDYKLIPSIERNPFTKAKTREEKIKLERKAIEIYRFNTKFILHPDFDNLLIEDITTLMLMQHYGAPTRLLDWSLSPLVAAFFASYIRNNEDENEDGLIWCFDYKRYEDRGSCQWKIYKEMGEGENFDTRLSPAFQPSYKNKWFVCQFLNQYKFPRILAQDGLFSFVSQFNEDHAKVIKNLLNGDEYCHLFIIKHNLKKDILRILNDTYHIWYGSIYPDIVGIALGTMNQLTNEYRDS